MRSIGPSAGSPKTRISIARLPPQTSRKPPFSPAYQPRKPPIRCAAGCAMESAVADQRDQCRGTVREPLELRPYQTEGIERLRESYASGRRASLFQLPTGGGKTVVFGAIPRSAASRGKRVLIAVHRRELLGQASDKLTWAGVAHGLIAAGFPADPLEPVQVCSVQTA